MGPLDPVYPPLQDPKLGMFPLILTVLNVDYDRGGC